MDERTLTTFYWVEDSSIVAAEVEIIHGGFYKKLETKVVIKRYQTKEEAEKNLEMLVKFMREIGFPPLTILSAESSRCSQ